MAIFQVIGCTSSKKTPQVEIFNQFESISHLDSAILSAKKKEVDNFAPKGFIKAQTLLNESIELAQDGKKEKAVNLSRQGLGIIQQAEINADKAKKEMWEVTDYRTKAIKAGSPELYKKEFEDADAMLRKTTALFENGEVQKARKNQPDLIEKYNTLERNALEKGVIELAKLSFEQAKMEGASKYAPKSLQRAKNELNVALSIIETDRTRMDKANEHAKIASVFAKNTSQISSLVKTFKGRKFSHEDIVLWYWQQLKKINEPFKDTMDFQQPNHILIQGMQAKIADLKQSYEKFSMDSQVLRKKQQDYIEKLNESHEIEISKLNNQLDDIKKKFKMEVSEQQKIREKKDRMELEMKQRFAFIQSLFDPTEAQIYRKGDNILISAHGFYFPSGVDEIQSSNFGLLNKILSSINQFPSARIEIYGHTDSVGPADMNLKLSGKRAQNVASFIAKVGQISTDRITHKGFGDTKPIAREKTKDGRAINRRIELMIIND